MKNIFKFFGIMFVVLGIGVIGKSAYAEESTDALLDMDYLQQYVAEL